MAIPKVLLKDILKHRIKQRKKHGKDKRIYIIFWVDFRTGKIIDSFTHSNLKCDKFLSNTTNNQCEDYIII